MAQCRADMNHVWRFCGEGLTVSLVKSERNNICDLTELGFDFMRATIRATQLIRVLRDNRSSGLCVSFYKVVVQSGGYNGAHVHLCILRD